MAWFAWKDLEALKMIEKPVLLYAFHENYVVIAAPIGVAIGVGLLWFQSLNRAYFFIYENYYDHAGVYAEYQQWIPTWAGSAIRFTYIDHLGNGCPAFDGQNLDLEYMYDFLIANNISIDFEGQLNEFVNQDLNTAAYNIIYPQNKHIIFKDGANEEFQRFWRDYYRMIKKIVKVDSALVDLAVMAKASDVAIDQARFFMLNSIDQWPFIPQFHTEYWGNLGWWIPDLLSIDDIITPRVYDQGLIVLRHASPIQGIDIPSSNFASQWSFALNDRWQLYVMKLTNLIAFGRYEDVEPYHFDLNAISNDMVMTVVNAQKEFIGKTTKGQFRKETKMEFDFWEHTRTGKFFKEVYDDTRALTHDEFIKLGYSESDWKSYQDAYHRGQKWNGWKKTQNPDIVDQMRKDYFEKWVYADVIALNSIEECYKVFDIVSARMQSVKILTYVLNGISDFVNKAMSLFNIAWHCWRADVMEEFYRGKGKMRVKGKTAQPGGKYPGVIYDAEVVARQNTQGQYYDPRTGKFTKVWWT